MNDVVLTLVKPNNMAELYFNEIDTADLKILPEYADIEAVQNLIYDNDFQRNDNYVKTLTNFFTTKNSRKRSEYWIKLLSYYREHDYDLSNSYVSVANNSDISFSIKSEKFKFQAENDVIPYGEMSDPKFVLKKIPRYTNEDEFGDLMYYDKHDY